MPLPQGSSLPEEKVFPIIPPDAYIVEILDIEEETKPSTFKNPDGTLQEDRMQYKIKFGIKDDGPQFDSWISAWINPSLRSSTKSKRPTLPQLLFAVIGKTFGPDDREKVNSDLLNSLIGSKLRVATQIEASKVTGKEYAVITTFLPLKGEKAVLSADVPFE